MADEFPKVSRNGEMHNLCIRSNGNYDFNNYRWSQMTLIKQEGNVVLFKMPSTIYKHRKVKKYINPYYLVGAMFVHTNYDIDFKCFLQVQYDKTTAKQAKDLAEKEFNELLSRGKGV